MDDIIDSPILQKCCYCEPSANKCCTDQCPCFVNGIICAEHCDYAKINDICLNRPITVCQCKTLGSSNDSHAEQFSSSEHDNVSMAGSSKKKLSYRKHNNKHNAKLENVCSTNACLCSKYNEMCTEQCQCKAECKNNTLKSPTFVDLEPSPILGKEIH